MLISHKHKFLFVATTKTGSTTIESVLQKYDSREKINTLDGPHNKHAPLLAIINKFPFVENYFKFGFVRNPFDWVVSWYSYRKSSSIPGGKNNANNTDGVTFQDWLSDKNSTAYNRKGIGLTLNQFDILKGDQKTEIDFIGKFENLQQDFNAICDKIGAPRQRLPCRNKSKHKHYTEYYNEETREIVAEKFAKDINRFGYEFGE